MERRTRSFAPEFVDAIGAGEDRRHYSRADVDGANDGRDSLEFDVRCLRGPWPIDAEVVLYLCPTNDAARRRARSALRARVGADVVAAYVPVRFRVTDFDFFPESKFGRARLVVAPGADVAWRAIFKAGGVDE